MSSTSVRLVTLSPHLSRTALLSHGAISAGGEIDIRIESQVKHVKRIFADQHACVAMIAGERIGRFRSEHHGHHSVEDKLHHVAERSTTNRAFAALLSHGNAFCWGWPADHGADFSSVNGQLQNVHHMRATARAFAAILRDGNVMTCGSFCLGGWLLQCRSLQHESGCCCFFAQQDCNGHVAATEQAATVRN